jgi:ferredoxin
MGLERKLETSLEPWLCFYCGQCSEQCPREAEPGETMMSLRRWLTSRYDVTGISKLFYRYPKVEIGAMIGLALLTGAGFLAWGFSQGDISIYDGEGAFLDSHYVHLFDWGMAAVLTALIASNSLRMWWLTVVKGSPVPVPIASYFKHAWRHPWQFLTQKRYAECGEQKPWLLHLALMLSYFTMFILIMFLLSHMQSDNWSPLHLFGYLATAGLVGASAWMIKGRLEKKEALHKHSHESDWIFLFQLFYVAVTGILQHILHNAGLTVAANVTYVLHMMGVVPMLVLEVPFSKWAHLAYRPLALYFAELRRDAIGKIEAPPLPAGARPVKAA